MENKTVYIRSENGIETKSGFQSKSEIKAYIEEEYEKYPGEYEYGFLDTISTVEIPEPDSQIDRMDRTRKQNLDMIQENVQNNDLCTDIEYVHDPYSKHHMKKYGQNVTHTSDVTFIIKVDHAKFSRLCSEKFGKDVSKRSVDKDVESEIMRLFNSVAADTGYYLGYVSDYKSRKMEERYLHIYGHVWENETYEQAVSDIMKNEFISGGYLKLSVNILPLRFRNDEIDVTDLDYIVLFDIDNNNEIEELQNETRALEYVDRLENNDAIDECTWIGTTPYYDSLSQLCAAVKFTDK